MSERQRVDVRGCRFQQTVHLADLEDGPELRFVDCHFEQGVCGRDAALGRSLTFDRCDFASPPSADEDGMADIALDLENACIDGDLTLFDCQLGGRLFAAGVRTTGAVRLRGIQIAPSLQAIPPPVRFDEVGAWHQPPPDKEPSEYTHLAAVLLDLAEIGGDLELTVAGNEAQRRTGGVIEALWSDDSSDMALAQASIVGGGVSCRLAEVRGRVLLAGTIVLGRVALDGIRVRGDCLLSFHGSWIQFRTRDGLSLAGAALEGACRLAMAEIQKDLTLYGARISGVVDLLGLKTGGDVNCNFATMHGYMNAFRTLDDRAEGRPYSLEVGNDLLISGAAIKFLELRGIFVQKEIRIINSTFGRLFLTYGLEPPRDSPSSRPSLGETDTVWPEPSEAETVRISAVTVDETLDVSGFLTKPREGRPTDASTTEGFTLQNSKVGGHVRFFTPDLGQALEGRWGAPPRWRRPGEGESPADTGGDGTPDKPEDVDFRARLRLGLCLEANVIGGGLDLRNIEVRGPIRLNDTSVHLDVEMGWRARPPRSDGRALTTACGHLDAEKLQCEGDVDLTGLLVAPELWEGERAGGPEEARRGTFLAREAHIRGRLLLLPPRDVRRGLPAPDTGTAAGETPAARKSRRPWYAFIGGTSGHSPVLDLTAVVASHLVLSGQNVYEREEAQISLERGQFSRLSIVEPTYDYIDLSNIVVSRWVFGDNDEPEADDYVRVLQHMKPFDRHTWIAVETMLRNQAKDDEADDVYRRMRLEARQRVPASRRWWHIRDRSVAWTTRYGTFPWPLMTLWVFFFAASLVVFVNPANVAATTSLLEVVDLPTTAEPSGLPAPNPPVVQTGLDTSTDLFRSPEASPAEFDAQTVNWGFWDAAALTLRYQVPIVPWAVHERWEASRRPLRTGFTAEHYALLVQIVSWIVWPLFLISVAAGFVRRRRV